MTVMDNNNNLPFQTSLDFYEEEENPIDWAGMLVKFLKHKWFIIIWTVVFAILGVGFALSRKPKYTVRVTLAPEVEGRSTSSSLRGIASMLGMGNMIGGNASGGVDAVNVTLFPEICSSVPFLTDLFSMPVTTYVSEKAYESGKRPKTTTLFKYISKEDEPKKGLSAWLEDIFGKNDKKEDNSVVNVSRLTKMQSGVVKYLSRAVSADVDKKTGVTTITVTLEDPQIAAAVADTVCQRLQDYVTEYRTKKAKNDYNYYSKLSVDAHEVLVKAQAAYASSVDFDRSVILQTVSSEKERLRVEAQLAQQVFEQMEQQKAVAKAKYQELKPAFAVIQPATMPLRPSGIGKKIIVLSFMLFGFVLATIWKLFVVDFISQLKADYKVRKAEADGLGT